ncbi:MAG: queuosine precursor transporter [Prolixibacteraceae bacterium]
MKRSVSVLFMMAGILFAICLLISNILATKIILIGSWAAPAGVLIFPIAYILNDVIVEVWGYQKARLIIWSGFAVNILAVLFFSLAMVMPAAPFWHNQEAFNTILGNTPRIIAASLTAYLTGSFLNAMVMSKVKVLMKGKNFSVRAILSTLVGETADSMIFIFIAFAGNLPLNALIGMVFTQALIKTIYEILILPFTILVVRWVKKVEGSDIYDHGVSYNPFLIKQV